MKVLLSSVAIAERLGELPPSVEWTDRAGPDVDLLVADPAPASIPYLRDVIPRCRNLRVIQSVNAGVDWLLPLVPSRVVVCAANGAHDIAVSEWVVTVLLALRRDLPRFWELQRAHSWADHTRLPDHHARPDLDGSQVRIVGYGSIGRAVAARLEPFGCKIIGIASRARAGVLGGENLGEQLPNADVVVLLAPLTDQTRGMVDRAFLARMRRGAILINAARGGLVDTEALVEALERGEILAGLDVTDPRGKLSGEPCGPAEIHMLDRDRRRGSLHLTHPDLPTFCPHFRENDPRST